VLVVTEQTNNKEKASRQTHTQETTKIRKKNTNGNTQKKRQKKNSEADSFRNMKVKISYTHEDGHVDRNI
jgi:hypothetical protein